MAGHAEDVQEVKLWRSLVGRGIAAAILGMVLMSNPRAPAELIGSTFLAYVILDAATCIFATRAARRTGRRASLLALIGITDGAATLAVAVVFPSAAPLLVIGGIRGIVTGACDVRWSVRQGLSDLTTFGGVAAAVLGIVMLAWPGRGIESVAWLLGLQMMVSGAMIFGGAMSEFRHLGEQTTARTVESQSSLV
ncbi:MAG TPA: DUF308 domain-containing protein [Labilithrix sp.]|jgi:uncharacterized membrane protein HdeD (DUF308 family)|nr:DUF308 domain-containing protein [Labilithrix sp.]